MSEPFTNLGGRLPLLPPAKLDAAQKELYGRINASYVPWAESSGFQAKTAGGALIGPFNPALYSPHIFASFLALQKQEGEHTDLTERARQAVILTVGSVWRSPYELYAHSAVAHKAGLSQAALNALASGETCDELTRQEGIAQQFTRRLAAERTADDALFASAYSAFGAKGLIDMVVLAGCYGIVCATLDAFNIPAPEDIPALMNEEKD
jgi:4-carboxymuconolactone decarboxylase